MMRIPGPEYKYFTQYVDTPKATCEDSPQIDLLTGLNLGMVERNY